MKRVLVVLTLPPGSCGHCDHYKATQHGKLRDLLRNHRDVDLLHFESAHNETGGRGLRLLEGRSDYYHPEMLTTYYDSFPAFYLFSAKDWMDPNRLLNGHVFGGQVIEKDGMRKVKYPENSAYDPRAEKIYAWYWDLASKDSMGGPSYQIKTYEQHNTDIRRSMIKRQ